MSLWSTRLWVHNYAPIQATDGDAAAALLAEHPDCGLVMLGAGLEQAIPSLRTPHVKVLVVGSAYAAGPSCGGADAVVPESVATVALVLAHAKNLLARRRGPKSKRSYTEILEQSREGYCARKASRAEAMQGAVAA